MIGDTMIISTIKNEFFRLPSWTLELFRISTSYALISLPVDFLEVNVGYKKGM
jgi:hypothetical protein